MSEVYGFDAFSPQQIAERVQNVGVTKARLPLLSMVMLGLLLVVVAGAELFTGNNLLAMAWADGQVTTGEVLRNWTVICAANFVGAACWWHWCIT